MAGKQKNLKELRLRLAGVTPETVDTELAVEMLAAYLDLLRLAAKEDGHELVFRGIHVRRGSCEFAMTPSSPTVLRVVAPRVRGSISGRSPAPRDGEGALARCRRAVIGLGKENAVQVVFGALAHTLQVAPVRDLAPPYEQTELRVVVTRVGGAPPRVRLTSPSEIAPFTLGVTKEQARELGSLLYGEVDVVARVVRELDGSISDGEVLEINRLSHGDAVEHWRAWFAEEAPEWADVDDVELELGRDG